MTLTRREPSNRAVGRPSPQADGFYFCVSSVSGVVCPEASRDEADGTSEHGQREVRAEQ